MIRRQLTGQLRQALEDTPAVLINGARQTGESTLVQLPEIEAQGRQYLIFDDPAVLEAGGLVSPVLHPGFCPAMK